MICLLHGLPLDGSPGNLWLRNMVEALCRLGETVHLLSHDSRPEQYPFISEAHDHSLDGTVETLLRRPVPYRGRCVLHRPSTLSDEELSAHLETNLRLTLQIVQHYEIHALHANHLLHSSEVAARASSETSIPFSITVHGEDLESSFRKDDRSRPHVESALQETRKIFVGQSEVRAALLASFPNVTGLDGKIRQLPLEPEKQAVPTIEQGFAWLGIAKNFLQELLP